MLKLVQLGAYAKRKPHQLSGGQQQRVALARSLAKKPQLLLLDEPLGALDKKLREETQIELANIIEDVGVTCVMVTHDQEEAMTMASRIAVMSEGRFLQVGAPAEIYETPASRFVADFIGNVNLMDGTLVEDEADHVIVDCGDLRHCVGHGITGTLGMAVTVALRPEKIRVAAEPPEPEAGVPDAGFNRVQGTVKDMAYFGSFTVYHLQLASRPRPQDQPEQHRAPAARAADLGRQRLGELVAAVAGGADAMKPALRGAGSRAGRRDRRSRTPGCSSSSCCRSWSSRRISVSEMEATTFKDIVAWKDGAIAFSLNFGNYLLLRPGQPLLQHLPLEPEVRRGHDPALPGDRLPVRLLHGARPAARCSRPC